MLIPPSLAVTVRLPGWVVAPLLAPASEPPPPERPPPPEDASASSPTAWTAVPTISAPVAGAGLRLGARRADGIPRGWAGCLSRLLGARPAGLRVGRAVRAGFCGLAAVAARGPLGGAARFSLRRCGRVRGRALSRSVGRSSLIGDQSWHAWAAGPGRVARNCSQVETTWRVVRKGGGRNAENVPSRANLEPASLPMIPLTSKNIALYSRFTGGRAPSWLPSAS